VPTWLRRPAWANGLTAPTRSPGRARGGGELGLFPSVPSCGAGPGVCRGGRGTSWLGAGSGTACSHLPPPPPPADGWGHGGPASVGMQRAVVQPCRAVLCHSVLCPAAEPPAENPSTELFRPAQRDKGPSSASCSHPRIPPIPTSLDPAPGLAGPLRGVPGGGWRARRGEGMEPPSSRSRPLVSRMSRRCHTHLMWFLAGAAAALSRLIAAPSSADR